MPRPNWSRPLPRPLKIPGVIDLKTLADVRTLIGHLPKATRAKSTWQYVERELKSAAAGADTTQLSIALQMLLMLECVEYVLTAPRWSGKKKALEGACAVLQGFFPASGDAVPECCDRVPSRLTDN
jgi:hypothetical protein